MALQPPKKNDTYISNKSRNSRNTNYRLLKSLIKAEEEDEVPFSETVQELDAQYAAEFELQEKNLTSPLFITKKSPLEALKSYFDPYPLLYIRKKFLFLKWCDNIFFSSEIQFFSNFLKNVVLSQKCVFGQSILAISRRSPS